MKTVAAILLFIPVFLAACSTTSHAPATGYNSVKSIAVNNAAVVSAHPLASEAGLEMLKAGGNAIDAVIATQFALAVVYPGAGNLGGGGFMVAHLVNRNGLPDSSGQVTIDYREKAPSGAHKDMYLDSLGNADLSLSQNGRLASGVPGTVAGLFAEMEYATLSLRQLIAPAIRLAEKGFAITAAEAGGLNHYKSDFIKYSSATPAFVRNAVWKAGDTLVQKELAATLGRIRDNGRDGFYKGETAKLIVAEMQKGNGIISMADLDNYQPKIRKPVRFNYKGYDVIGMDMPSSGGLLLKQMMKMIEPFAVDNMLPGTALTIQLMTEVERRAFADRAEYMGDADFVKVPVAALSDESYLKNRMADFKAGVAGNSTTTQPGNIPHESKETTHISVMDKFGNGVSVTTTLNGGYGSRTVVAGAGFLMNNEMDDFSAKPGVPNMYGALGTEANAIAAGKRMLSSMTPTLVLKNGEVKIVTGTPGGTTIPTSVFQTLIDIIDFHMIPSAAIAQPKFHHQWQPDEIQMEPGFPRAVVDSLVNMGYKIRPVSAIGRVEIIMKDDSGKIFAAADTRGGDSAAGY